MDFQCRWGVCLMLLGFLYVVSGAQNISLGRSLLQNVARTPPMGWNSWNHYGCNINERIVRDTADHLASSGLSGMGYKYVNIDDCWAEPNRDSNGRLVPSHSKFPSGIKALADYVHSKGLKLGIYSDVGVHNVLAVNGSSFANCVKEATSGKFESGHDDLEIKKSGNTWVISGVGQD